MSTGPRVVGRYTLHGQIAAGGMATVHLGQMTGPLGFSKVVAVKRLHDKLATNPELVAMFVDEARLVARLQHPNIVSIIDVVAESGELLLVMEYVKGAALSTLLAEASLVGRQCTPRIAARIIADVLAGLHHAHETTNSRGELIELVHRDVSPQNIIVGLDGIARLLDFGIAKATGRLHQTRVDQVKGKIAYMPPELIDRQPLDRRADVYATGVVLWEALTGRRLFDGPADASLFARIAAGRVPPVSDLRPGLERYDAVVARAVHRDPAARYATAREMLLALEQCGPAATANEVAAWVEPLAAKTLADRAPLVHEIETRFAPLVPAPSQPPPERQRRSAWPWALVVVLASSLLAVGIAATRARSSSAPGSASAPPMESSAPAASITFASEPSANSPPAESAVTPLGSSTEKRRPARPPRPRLDCDPPWVLDSAGHRRYKMECVREP